MYKEKHILNKHYGSHKLARYLDVYETTLQTNGYGTISANSLTSYNNDIVSLSATPNADYSLSGYSITGATLTSNQYKITNSDVTAKAWFIRNAFNLTLQNDGHGTIHASTLTGRAGDTSTLSNTPNTEYALDHYAVTGATLNNNVLTFGDSDATAKGYFKINGITIADVPTGGWSGSLGGTSISDANYFVYQFDQLGMTQPHSADLVMYSDMHMPVEGFWLGAGPTGQGDLSNKHIYLWGYYTNGMFQALDNTCRVVSYNTSQTMAIDYDDADANWHTFKYIIQPRANGPDFSHFYTYFTAYKDNVPKVSGMLIEPHGFVSLYESFNFNKHSNYPGEITALKNLKVRYFNNLSNAQAFR